MISEKIKTLHTDILYPTVMVGAKKANGSGVIIRQKKDKGRFKVYVITAYHCISSSLKDKKVKITHFKYKNWSKSSEEIVEEAFIVAYSKKYDLALLKFYSKSCLYCSKIDKDRSNIFIFDKVYACGCGLGYNPIITQGNISNMNENHADTKHRWIITAPITDGNSGGGIYLAKNKKLIGIACEVGKTDKNIEVNHMCFILPICIIKFWLKKYIKI